jgi:hypothetical protein
VPSETPIGLNFSMPLEKPLFPKKGWFWARRSEQRVCVGCHVGPARAPDNVAPAVLAGLLPLITTYGGRYALTAIPSDIPWGKASQDLKATFVALRCYQCHEVSGVELPKPACGRPYQWLSEAWSRRK